jgi:hypothetical protein
MGHKAGQTQMQNRIFSTDSAKAIKAQGFGYINAIQYMAPAELGGVGNLCPHASAGCRALCLGWMSGQASMVADLERDMNSVRLSRIQKAQRFMKDRAAYLRDVVHTIELLRAQARKAGKKLCVRLNGSTDISWEGVVVYRTPNLFPVRFANMFEAFPDVDFVDYTKNPRRFDRALPANYHLTFSRSETNEAQAIALLNRGINVAVVFERKPEHGTAWRGFMVIDGDEHDLRQLDPRATADQPFGYVIALTPKGRKAKRDTSGFVVRQ